ncbi:hypothetical protein SLS62_001696 [Diatrype stigma]|uniref:Uncharacterized protein n=1 Tax=Diatrype stigma TaxID=117547 RepID=A0AAN9YWI9_9PEZI
MDIACELGDSRTKRKNIMRFTDLIVGATAASGVLAAPGVSKNKKRQGGFDFTGVNQSGAEFGQDTLPGQLGKEYTWPVNSAIDVRRRSRSRRR